MTLFSSPLPKTIAALAALSFLSPLSLLVVAGTIFSGALRSLFESHAPPEPVSSAKTILLSGGKMTKALQLARSFHSAGHRVILIESEKYWLTAHRFSNSVDRFYTVPAPDSPTYVDALISIIKREGVSVYVPVCSPVSSLFDSNAMPRLSEYCEVIHVGPEMLPQLDDKYAFAQVASSLGLRAPKSVQVTTPADVLDFDFTTETRKYILKSIKYDALRRLDLTRLPCATRQETEAFVHSLPISPENPWVMQEFIPGTEYCTHGTLRDGELRVHCCCKSSPFQVNYCNEVRPDVEEWVRRFGSALALTGQVSLDFIQADDDGHIYAIECNPRAHSAITMFYNHTELSAAYIGSSLSEVPIAPLTSSRPTFWLYHELWRLLVSLPSPVRTLERLRVIACGKEAVLDWRDPLPFLMLYHWHMPLLLLRDVAERRGWIRIDFNIGKLVQAGGD